MTNYMEAVGLLHFDDKFLDVYYSLNEPLFRLSDIAELLQYDETYLTDICEVDEISNLAVLEGGQTHIVKFIDEHGLYNALSQARTETARKWRRVIFDDLVVLRHSKNLTITEQFDEWDSELDSIYIDPETGIMMQSVTVEGGDVIQVPYEE